MPLKKGFYETLIYQALQSSLALEAGVIVEKEKIDSVQAAKILADYLALILEKGFQHFKDGEKDLFKQIGIANNLIEKFARQIEDPEFIEYLIKEEKLLKGVYSEKAAAKNRPLTSIAQSALFTGAKTEPSIQSELAKEILSADRVDLLVSFIKFSGLRLLLPALKKHTETKALRVLTTSYLGATDYKAILELSKLPNTEIRISYDTERTRLHAKAYYFERETGFSTAYIGSSNMSRSALTDGLEWNLKISEHTSAEVMEKYRATFESYWNSPDFVIFDPNNLEDQRILKRALQKTSEQPEGLTFFTIQPYTYQRQILEQLKVEREIHQSRKNLIVAATGTGKTIIAAFDFKQYYSENPQAKLLFLAHRKEILNQANQIFKTILRDYNFGDLWVGEHQPQELNHLFASIQTLTVGEKYKDFSSDYFDFIILDEAHHASAETYDQLLDYFQPDLLLGLTATPERLDGQDIRKYFNSRIASEIRLHEAIERGLLVPFHYFGVTDSEDVDNLNWSRGSYDEQQLSNLYTGNHQRANLIIESLDHYLTDFNEVKGLGFCVSKEHAAFMSDYFNKKQIPALNLDADSKLEVRNTAQKQLSQGKIKFIFAVDLYNEGVDIPEINTVLFLRPTKSPTIFIQQLGRGLRLHEDKDVLTVLDFVGRANQNFNFEHRYRQLLGRTKHSLVAELQHGFPSLPKGCFIQLERKAEAYILENLNQFTTNKRKLISLAQRFTLESVNSLNLENFLEFYELEPWMIYRNWSLRQICHEAGLQENYQVEDQALLKTSLRRVMFINSKVWLDFLLAFLQRPIYTLDRLTKEEKLMLTMFHYTIWARDAEGDLLKYLNKLRRQNSDLFSEILELLEYNRKKIDFLEEKLEFGYPLPLELYARYSTTEILAAFGENTAERLVSFREGVKYLPEYNTDLFFITLDKSDKSFSLNTKYDDYVINDRLIHWQSQSRTADTSPTGQRYIGQRKNNSTVLLFMREAKTENSKTITAPFYFLGKANYISHQGSKPISFVWELEKPLPAFLFQKFKDL